MNVSSVNVRTRLALLALVAMAACGDNLIRDPSFDLWCGTKLCAPWEAKGQVTRVGTWHKNDYGVSLADGAQLSQLSTHEPVKCIEFSIIADVDARAGVQVEMDFQDDGTSEYQELVPESHWATLRYVVKAPSWYHDVRFIVRKVGKGRAVVAQVQATSADDCENSPAVKLLERPSGANCESMDQCASQVCEPAPVHFVDLSDGQKLFMPGSGKDPLVCSSCSADADCAKGELCDVATDGAGAHRACVKPGSLPLGAWCTSADVCESGLCTQGLALEHGSCAECEHDSDCKSGEVCGVQVFTGGAARSCHAPSERKLGGACAADAECGSGVCCGGICSECCDAAPCKNGKTCSAAEEFVTTRAKLCDSGAHSRAAGAACNDDSDCSSLHCDVEKPQCYVRCEDASCGGPADLDCGFLRRLAGVCR